jgi:hypothetical protein
MGLADLLADLRSADPWLRVETLRILAMVEETRALGDIEWVYRNDPEPGVRQVAQWAGRLVYAALRQAQQADATATPASGTQIEAQAQEEALLARLMAESDPRTALGMEEVRLQRALTEAIRTTDTHPMPAINSTPPGVPIPPALPTVPIPPAAFGMAARRQSLTALTGPFDADALLDAGLSDDFFRDD